MKQKFILTFICKDTTGIIAAVTTFLSQQQAFICELSEFGDPVTEMFFLRCLFEWSTNDNNIDYLSEVFKPIAEKFRATWKFIEPSYKPKTFIMVSKYSHCLNDLLYRNQAGRLKMSVEAVISNHPFLQEMSSYFNIPFIYLPVTKNNKTEQEDKLLSLIEEKKIELVILARYMQILSPLVTKKLPGKIINIHHSFLPSFKGAKPYHQAFERGVKLIGATSHYVTEALDEGPIIEQEVLRVSHIRHPEELVSIGYDIEAQVLARAVAYHTENRVFINGNKTVIFN